LKSGQPAEEAKPETAPETPKPKTAKLTYSEKKELAGMEEAILEAEEALAEIVSAVEVANIAADHTKLVELYPQQQEAQNRVASLYARWEELEGKAS
jgi:ATP-binding cassette subfamily F protein uup